VTQDEPVNLWNWVSELLAALDLPPVRGRLPLWVARAAGTILETVYGALSIEEEPLVTRWVVNELAMNHYYDISRAKAELAYKPQIDMAEVTRRVVAHLKQEMGR
jgi:nucleoside-diphosphate-sugar epimerase